MLMKAKAIATRPNSSGESNLAKKIETIKLLTWVTILPKKSHENALIVLLLKLNLFAIKFLLVSNPLVRQYQWSFLYAFRIF